jgi:hypothetical protein
MANRILQNAPGRYRWVYFIDDGAYVRPWKMGDALNITRSNDIDGTVLGYFGCETSSCTGGLCEGGGIVMNPTALERAVGDNETEFMQQHIHYCGTCGRWPTLGLTEMFRQRNISMHKLEGIFPWKLSKECFDARIHSEEYEPLVFNNVSTQRQMHLLDELFFTGPVRRPMPTVVPWPDHQQRCVKYRTVEKCSLDMQEVPWVLDWQLTGNEPNCSEPEIDITLKTL